MKKVFIVSVILFALLVVAMLKIDWTSSSGNKAGAKSLLVFCAPALKAPVEKLAKEYEAAFGVNVQLQYQPSQTLLSSVEITKKGDLFIPADDSFNVTAKAKNLIDEMLPLARMHVVIAVKKGNPKNIKSLADFSRDDVKFALAGEAAAVTVLAKKKLVDAGLWDGLAKKAVFKGAVNEVANDVQIGSVDAGLVWNTNVSQVPVLEAVEQPVLESVQAMVSAAVLKSTTDATAALRFARYLSAGDKGLLEFKKAGFDVADGDAWTESPELKLFAGAMLRPAIEETIARFEKRENVRVTRVYNGCGILVSQMRAAEGANRPDAYFACDKQFMKQVADLFLDEADVSQNQLVILVKKGNPKGVKELKDLGKADLKLGIGHEKQCALGALTSTTFKVSGVFDGVMKNVKVQSATGDLLVNQLLTGSLDAVVAYVSNAAASADKLDAIRIDIPCALAVQPFATAKASKNKQLSARLLSALKSAESKERFESQGFYWKADEKTLK